MEGIDCIAALKALGELSRLRIMRLLLKEQLGVNDISKRLKMSQYNTSKHLRILREAGLLQIMEHFRPGKPSPTHWSTATNLIYQAQFTPILNAGS